MQLRFGNFGGGPAIAAGVTFPAAAGFEPLLRIAAIDDLRMVVATLPAVHARSLRSASCQSSIVSRGQLSLAGMRSERTSRP